ncbi:ATP-dependent DNA helicase [Coprinopsis sp. MPI-PUGE-AT-0042]|nr:ATP-dependent DNA helicase [Coprinopsis sp. MPI-PUGE-AT-0042]
MNDWNGHPNQAQIDEINGKLAENELDLKEVNEGLKALQTQKEKLLHDGERLKRTLRELTSKSTAGKGKGKAQATINYTDEPFDWDDALRGRMRKVFGIQDFRHCQKGVCNANMDGRDIVCVMPTGGGKSLTYQLPSLLTPGVTLVVSPLLALINDQVIHLRERGIEAVMLTGETSTSGKKDITKRLHDLANRVAGDGNEIKLCYVTPEKLAKDKTFVSLLGKLSRAGRLARFVIDEAHCVSQLGHDFRPDYKELHMFRQLFPRVPIMALSATCPPQVLQDLIKILGLRPVVGGNEANTDGTIYFSSPLYRKNLHYKILPKSASGAPTCKAMSDWILEHHPTDTGIIYCLTQKDCETVADEVHRVSESKIRTGVYHASIGASEKLKLHNDWRAGKVKVVCATIAFGLGIDKGDVRFVLHYSIPKSVDGYYQESGRAGRDGKDSDCVLFYRPQDFSSVAGLISKESSGITKLHDVLKFVEDVEECRKIQFAKYFSHSANMSVAAWSTSEQDALQRCGHCDNCTRSPASLHSVDVTLQSWQIIKILQMTESMGSKVTLQMLAGLARGKNGGKIDVKVKTGGKGRGRTTKQTQELDLDTICGGAVDLSGPDTERLIIRLLTDSYLKEEFIPTAYSTNVYLVRGGMAHAFLQRRRDDITSGGGRRIQVVFIKPEAKTRKKATTSKDPNKSAPTASKSKKSKADERTRGRQTQIHEYSQSQAREQSEEESDPDEFINVDADVEEALEESDEEDEGLFPTGRRATLPKPPPQRMSPSPPPMRSPKRATRKVSGRKRSLPSSSRTTQNEVIELMSTDEEGESIEDSEDDGDGWLMNQRGKPPPRKKARVLKPTTTRNGKADGSGSGKQKGWSSDEESVMVVSSS